MRSEPEARALPHAELDRLGHREDVALTERPIESEHYWVYVYNTVEFWRTRDIMVGLVGNRPIAVPKDGGPVFRLETAHSVERQLHELEAQRRRTSGDDDRSDEDR